MKYRKSIIGLMLLFAMLANLMSVAVFTDTSSTKYENEINMLQQLGILNGYADGSFKPEASITRAEFAKMIYVARTGRDDKGGAFASVASKFQDVNGHWAKGYINYAESLGIIQGRSATRFDPDAKLTAVEAAKMGLLLLGYNAEKEGMIGLNWQSNVTARAINKGIFKNFSGDPTQYTDRQSAALILYNTIFAKTVIYSTVTNIAHDEKTTLGEKTMNLSVIEGIAIANEYNRVEGDENAPKKSAVIRRKYGGDITIAQPMSDSMLGKAVKAYVKTYSPMAGSQVESSNIQRVYGEIVEDANKNYVVTAANADVTYQSSPKPTITYKQSDGKKVSFNAASASAFPLYVGYSRTAADQAELGERTNEGVVFISNDGNSKTVEYIIKIPMEYAEIISYNEKYETLKLSNGQTFDFENLIMADSFKRDDRVLVYQQDGKTVLHKAGTFTGKLIGTSGNKANIGGQYYEAGKIKGSRFELAGMELTSGVNSIISDVFFNKSIQYYTDGKYIVEAVLPDTAKTPSNYAMVTNSGTDNLWSGVVPKVRVVFADNTTESYEVSKLDNVNMKDTAAVKKAFDNNAATGLYRYVLFNNKLELYSASQLESPGAYDPQDNVLTDGSNRYYADDETVFFVRTDDEYRAYAHSEIKSPVKGLSGTKGWVATESWGGQNMLKAVVFTTEYLPSPNPMDEIKSAFVLDYPESQFNPETEKWFLTLKVLMDGQVRTISGLDGVKESGFIGLGSYGGVYKGDFLRLTLTADGEKIAHIEKPKYRSNTLTLPVADGIYAGTIYKMSDQWLSVYPYDKSQENDGSIQPVALSAQDASYYTIDGDEVGHGHIPETTATPDSPIQAGAYNAIIVIKDKKVKEVFVNETGFWK